MKSKVAAGLVLAGVLGIAGTALAKDMPKYAATTSTKKPPMEFQQGERPPLPPKGAPSFDKKPPEFDGKKRPPMSGDKRLPKFDGKRPPMSGDKRLPMPPKSK
ncbi:MAG: hypothetical protein IJR85_07610 [Synergistaceae bacterium]|nr:hypothetical protein [Synergistaceae bacterium]